MVSGPITAESARADGGSRAARDSPPSRRRIATSGRLPTPPAAALAGPSCDQRLPLAGVALGTPGAPVHAVIAVAPAVFMPAAGVLARWSRPGGRLGLPAGSSPNRRVHAVRRFLEAADTAA